MPLGQERHWLREVALLSIWSSPLGHCLQAVALEAFTLGWYMPIPQGVGISEALEQKYPAGQLKHCCELVAVYVGWYEPSGHARGMAVPGGQ